MNTYGPRILLAAAAVSVGVAAPGCREAPARAPGKAPPQRIVCLAPNATETIGLLRATDRLVAVSDFCIWPPEAKQLPRVGGLFDPRLEEILRLRPDLVILRGRNQSVERLCKDAGIALLLDRTESFNDIYTTLAELGRLLGRQEDAAHIDREMRARLATIAVAVESLPKPRVFMTLARNPDSLSSIMTGAKGTFIDEMIRMAGGVNVFADVAMSYPTISTEAILLARPDVIIDAMPEEKMSPQKEARIRAAWIGLGPTPAAKNGRIHVLSDENCYIPSPRIVDVIAKLARLLHPEVSIDD